MVFHATDATHGRELWMTDGTPGGTAILKDILPGAGSGTDPYPMWNQGDSQAVLGNTLFFQADDGVHGRELWKTDGTPAGAVLLKDIYPGARSSDIDWMTAAAGRVYFVADDGVHGRELWTSDGTAAGTHLAKDIVAGAASPTILAVRSLGHLALFSADDGVHGRELWRSDGGAAGTFLVADLASGAAPSNPLEFTAVGSQVYFTADDNVAGNELWSVPAATLLTTFQDVPPDSWAWGYVEALVAAGITTGCAPGEFCIGGAVTRAEIAAFLERGIQGPGFVPPPPTGTRFTDVPATYWAADWIEQLAADGITTGCAPNTYCPGSLVNRAEMAVFLLRARHGGAYVPPAVAASRFTDVPAGFWARDWIEQLAVEGITTGCAPNLYCPGDSVGRDQMAAFLARTFQLLLP
jgi:ELWxxDGT repeat protein